MAMAQKIVPENTIGYKKLSTNCGPPWPACSQTQIALTFLTFLNPRHQIQVCDVSTNLKMFSSFFTPSGFSCVVPEVHGSGIYNSCNIGLEAARASGRGEKICEQR